MSSPKFINANSCINLVFWNKVLRKASEAIKFCEFQKYQILPYEIGNWDKLQSAYQ